MRTAVGRSFSDTTNRNLSRLRPQHQKGTDDDDEDYQVPVALVALAADDGRRHRGNEKLCTVVSYEI